MKKEELEKMHKDKCRQLKKMRAEMAEQLEIDLKQRECTYKGYCSGTCPKCQSEERQLNDALMKKQLFMKKTVAAGIITTTIIGMSGCQFLSQPEVTEGVAEPEYVTDHIEGDVAAPVDELSPADTQQEDSEELEIRMQGDEVQGLMPTEDTELYELEGDVVVAE